MRTNERVFRQVWPPETLGTFRPDAAEWMALQVLRRIRGVHAGRQCGCYVFMAASGAVYVVSEERSVAAHWLRDRFRELVGFYAVRARANGLPWLAPTVEGLAEDLADHWRQIREA